jgi:hypothetical protein
MRVAGRREEFILPQALVRKSPLSPARAGKLGPYSAPLRALTPQCPDDGMALRLVRRGHTRRVHVYMLARLIMRRITRQTTASNQACGHVHVHMDSLCLEAFRGNPSIPLMHVYASTRSDVCARKRSHV